MTESQIKLEAYLENVSYKDINELLIGAANSGGAELLASTGDGNVQWYRVDKYILPCFESTDKGEVDIIINCWSDSITRQMDLLSPPGERWFNLDSDGELITNSETRLNSGAIL